MDERGPWIGHLTKAAQMHVCNDGWICEEHPEQGYPHDDCGPQAALSAALWQVSKPALAI
jgi:hypothetical protein